MKREKNIKNQDHVEQFLNLESMYHGSNQLKQKKNYYFLAAKLPYNFNWWTLSYISDLYIAFFSCLSVSSSVSQSDRNAMGETAPILAN